MSLLFVAILLVVLWVGPLLLLGGVLRVARAFYHRRDRRNPLTKGLLRGPGHTLREQLEDLRFDLAASLAIYSALPLFLFALFSSYPRVPGDPAAKVSWIGFAIIALIGLAVGSYKIVGMVKRARNLSLGLEAETAVGQELNLLMKDGFSVFHDIPGDKAFNIDHVVVGPQGVFSIETKGRSKPVKTDGGEGHRMEYKDGVLHFPGWTETAPIEQAKRNADWLRKWLSSAVGTPVDVTPVLMLPGWFTEAKSRPTVAIMNGVNSRKYFLNAGAGNLSDQLVHQIVHQLDTRCRDVEPRSYRPLPD